MSGICFLPLLCALTLGLLYVTNTVEAFPSDCCNTFSKKALPLKLIKGFTIQKSYEVCDIDAVIFITKKFRICANPKDQWVLQAVKELRTRKRKMLKSI